MGTQAGPARPRCSAPTPHPALGPPGPPYLPALQTPGYPGNGEGCVRGVGMPSPLPREQRAGDILQVWGVGGGTPAQSPPVPRALQWGQTQGLGAPTNQSARPQRQTMGQTPKSPSVRTQSPRTRPQSSWTRPQNPSARPQSPSMGLTPMSISQILKPTDLTTEFMDQTPKSISQTPMAQWGR